MSGFLFDTNVLLDIATADPTWLVWSEGQFRTAAAQGPILSNPIIYAEQAFRTGDETFQWLLDLPLDAIREYAGKWIAAKDRKVTAAAPLLDALLAQLLLGRDGFFDAFRVTRDKLHLLTVFDLL